jgi:predicted cupin superfamily sugar epimerase
MNITIPVPIDKEPDHNDQLIRRLKLIKHPEGGYYKETDRSRFKMPCPYPESTVAERNYSTLIYYYLSPSSPIGKLHRNRSRIIHILQKGSGTYVLIHPDGIVETFEVGFGPDQRMQWVVDGGIYKASFTNDSDGLLISEVVVPGFDFDDHNFMASREELVRLVGENTANQLDPLLGGH